MRTLSDEDVEAIAMAMKNILKTSVLKPPKRKVPDRTFISQTKAWAIYGKSNVVAWRNAGMVQAYKRMNRIEYEIAELEAASRAKQILPKRK